jgi:hypothetical protein
VSLMFQKKLVMGQSNCLSFNRPNKRKIKGERQPLNYNMRKILERDWWWVVLPYLMVFAQSLTLIVHRVGDIGALFKFYLWSVQRLETVFFVIGESTRPITKEKCWSFNAPNQLLEIMPPILIWQVICWFKF